MRIPFRSTMVLEGERESALRVNMRFLEKTQDKARELKASLSKWYGEQPTLHRRAWLGSFVLVTWFAVEQIFGWPPKIEKAVGLINLTVTIDNWIMSH